MVLDITPELAVFAGVVGLLAALVWPRRVR